MANHGPAGGPLQGDGSPSPTASGTVPWPNWARAKGCRPTAAATPCNGGTATATAAGTTTGASAGGTNMATAASCPAGTAMHSAAAVAQRQTTIVCVATSR